MRVLLCLLFAGCVIGFDIPYSIPQQTVPGDTVSHAAGTLLSGSPVDPFALDISLSQQEQANHVSAISHVYLTSLSFDITSGGSDCFDFVQSVTLSVASTKSGSALPTAVIATGTSPGCVRHFALTPTSVDLKPYIDEGAQVTSSGQGVPPDHDETFDGQLVLHADT
jgi:hypothetical protein